MNKNWKFYKGYLENGFSPSLDDSDWEDVNLGHTWNNIDGQDGNPTAKNINDTDYYRGDGWYRKYIELEKEDKDKLLYLRFQGANIQADVYVNGKLAGSHKGGYTAFNINITPYVDFESANLIAVRVNNERTEEIAPITADFTFYGGIYREMELVRKNAVHFGFGEYSSRGLKISTPTVTDNLAVCTVEAIIENNSDKAQELCVNALISQSSDFDKNEYIKNVDFNIDSVTGEKQIAEQSEKIIAEANSHKAVSFTFEIKNPILWNGRENPYLYETALSIEKNGEMLDFASDKIGFRYYSVDKDNGFFLNGKSYPLRGVSRHQDREGLGNALTKKEHDEDFALIYDMGVTAIRLAHYPQAEYFYNMCDRYGIVVWAEIPFVDEVGGNGSYENPDERRREFFNTTKHQLRELINQNYNHPSIVCWGLQNEVRAKYDDVMIELMNELYDVAKAEDKYRLLTQATNQKTAYNWKSDLLAWNIYPGWYGMRRTQLGWFMDKNRCGRPLGISEYGAGGNHTQHTERPKRPKHDGQWHPEEYQTLCHEAFIKQINKRQYLWSTFVWNMFDFGSDGRNEGAHPGMNDKGLVSFDRKVKKDSYYVYQCNWSKHPMVQIAETRNTNRKKRLTCVKVYSNCDNVTLYNNGKKIKTAAKEKCRQRGIFKFNIWLCKGENKLCAKAVINSKVYKSEAVFKY